MPQEFSDRAIFLLRENGDSLPFTPWHRLEVRNAIRLAVFHGLITSLEAKTQLKQIEDDVREEALIVHTPIEWVAVLRRAENLGSARNEKIGCRSSDLFHIATALELKSSQFLTFDERQRKMAKAAGLHVRI